MVVTESGLAAPPRLIAKSRPMRIQRLADRSPATVEAIVERNRLSGAVLEMDVSAWIDAEIFGPDVSDKETLVTMAEISGNAYYTDPLDPGWRDVGSSLNLTDDFGWEESGLRGHIFADETNSTIIMGLKGTTVAWFDGSDTTTNDKVNDNLFFGCCCGAQSSLTRKVCDCQQSTNVCGAPCLTKALLAENRYYRAALDLYSNVTERYPNSEIWLAGHSLGGSVSSLLGHTYNRPAVAVEAPAEALAISRIGIHAPPGVDPRLPQTWGIDYVHHIGNSADPIFMGECNGVSSSCNLVGYAMESQCHAGQLCIYDVVADRQWRKTVANHRIRTVIDTIIKTYNQTPECIVDNECLDCAAWKFVKTNFTTSTTLVSTSTSSSTTTSRTTTCKTPGWWGCLDQTTTTQTTTETLDPTSTTLVIVTSTTTTTSTQTTTKTSTCKTPGWFGCNDKKTTSTTTTTSEVKTTETSTNLHMSTSCHTPGYIWGCKDRTTALTSRPTSHLMTPAPTGTYTSPAPTATSCKSHGLFGFGCRDPVPAAAAVCVERTRLGLCKEWSTDMVREDI
jgi:lipase ATG15